MPETDYAYWNRADELIRLALEEDLPGGDITTRAVLRRDVEGNARFLAKEDLSVSGIEVARRVLETVDPDVRWEPGALDGDRATGGEVLARAVGKVSSLLAAERTALNFLQHLSGIATATMKVVERVRAYPAIIMDTRKTLPGWRVLEKAAVRHGGGTNHRFSLSDAVLIKDNHVALSGGVGQAVTLARSALPPRTRIEVETSSPGQVREALQAGADVILVDNSTPEELAEAVRAVGDDAVVEVSGSINEDNVESMARTGVAIISLGALTHSARAVDISMKIETGDGRP